MPAEVFVFSGTKCHQPTHIVVELAKGRHRFAQSLGLSLQVVHFWSGN